MIGDSSIEAIVKTMRSKTTRLSLDEATAFLNGSEPASLNVPVEVEFRENSLHCLLRSTDSLTLPPAFAKLLVREGSGPISVTEKDYFRIKAKTSEGVQVLLEGASPLPSHDQSFINASGRNNIHSFDFQRIQFPAVGADLLNTDELLDELHQAHRAVNPSDKDPRKPRQGNPEDEHFAIIPGVKLLIRSDGITSNITHPFLGESKNITYSCFTGEIGGGQFCLQDKSGDLLVYFNRPVRSSVSPGPTSIALFDGILKAIGFTHGIHPWPFYRQHRVDHRVVTRWARPPAICATDGLRPMSEGRLRQAKDSRNLFVKAAEFFAAEDEQSETFHRALWLLHGSNPAGMPFELRVLTLCSVLEGLVKQHAGGNLGSKPEPWKKGIESLSLDWSWFEKVYLSWNNYRNKLAHGFDVLPSATNPRDITDVYSRMFAAIYVIMARQMGYTGKLEASMLENRDAVLLTEKASAIVSLASAPEHQTEIK